MNQKLMHISATLIAIFLAASATALPSHAQTGTPAQDLPTRDQSYFRNLVSLAETIGSAHAVRVRCNGVDDQYWRAYMVQTLGLEAPLQGSLRQQMVAGFNRGFQQENAVRIPCDASAIQREARYAITGRQLADSLAAFYFPNRPAE